eukprot:TRINITY_DN83708_c0_g1_i7.p1 TRINITY_DN83708_c0_g1~~TRINITY_DN83708_c0_g1_i7.p1  ORF type:complete len:458 (-),score=51.62 TRINITY_DN83708_c0_g1_i7:192-1565(-)
MATPQNKKPKLDNPSPKQEPMEIDDTEDLLNYTQQTPIPQLMSQYYKQLFPCTEIYKWLSYGNNTKHPQADAGYFRRREFCFTLQGDIFVRYQSFDSVQELRDALIKKQPAKIDLGPVYSRELAQRGSYGVEFQPVEREFVIDIDIDGYNNVRTCCDGNNICQRCWPLMACGIEVLDTTLRHDFGFNHILWVFSGRRGVHCWVCDYRARKLSNEQRSAIVTYLAIYKGQEKENSKLQFPFPPTPSIKAAYTMLEKRWLEYVLPAQMWLTDAEMQEKVLALVGDSSLSSEIREEWSRMASEEDNSVERWQRLKHLIQQKIEFTKDFKERSQLEKSLFNIVFSFTYPRLDADVSRKMNHLLKAPFCVHPKTGNVCVPIDPKNAYEFLLHKVPKVQELIRQLSQKENKENVTHKQGDWMQTDLQEAIEFFQKQFLLPLVNHNNTCLSNKIKKQSQQIFEW